MKLMAILTFVIIVSLTFLVHVRVCEVVVEHGTRLTCFVDLCIVPYLPDHLLRMWIPILVLVPQVKPLRELDKNKIMFAAFDL